MNAMLSFILIIISVKNMSAQQNNQKLPVTDRAIVSIAAFTANGDQQQLKTALNTGLDSGLTINEIKEVLVQLYAYCGFPRSLNAITTFMTVLDERKAKGIKDIVGQEGVRVESTNKYEQGLKTLEDLTGKSQNGALIGANAFAPCIDVFLKEHLFADIFGRGVLTYQRRELATITVLATLPGLGSQLQAHIGMGQHVGLTEAQLREVFAILEKKVSRVQAEAANAALENVIAAK